MKESIKKFIRPFIPASLLNLRKKMQMQKQYSEWEKKGRPAPSPHILKQKVIAEYQYKHRCSHLIETGTYLGDMVEAQKKRFKKIISIEIGHDLAEKEKERFKNDTNIRIIQGDSGKVLSDILKDIREQAIFWLDGHYSAGITSKGEKDCPIFEELNAILENQKYNHVLLIDDARCFNGQEIIRQ